MSPLLVLGALALPVVARADAVGPPPTSCPPYSMGVSCHGPPHCAPTTCASDAVCTGGTVCQPTPMCIEAITCGGWGGSTPEDNVTGSCGSGSSCPSGSSCQTRMACSPPTRDAGFYPDGGAIVLSQYGCCSVAGAHGVSSAALLPLTLAGLLTLRVRRRKRGVERDC